MSDPRSAKQPLRQQLLAWRRGLSPDVLHEASRAIAGGIGALPEVRAARVVALYQALRNEIEMEPLWRELVLAGKQVLFPRIHPGTRQLAFALVDDPAELEVGALGVRQPPASRDVPLGSIDLIVVPALAFDAEGRRLGRGGGYYDATLAAHPAALRVGPCLEAALLDEVPAEVHDEAVDVVVTEARVLRPSRHRR